MNMNQTTAKIIADSKNKQGDRIISFVVEFPRIVLAELNTHRMFSRNSASSRAIPFKKMVKMVEENPFIPIAWQKDHSGMQGAEYLMGGAERECVNYWLEARDNAVRSAKKLNEDVRYCTNTVTKQLCNRLLEPFMMHKVLMTATEFENFFSLRCPNYSIKRENGSMALDGYRSKNDVINESGLSSYNGVNVENMSDLEWLKINKSQAEIHIQALAEAMWDAINESTPKELKAGEWHIPFGNKFDNRKIEKLRKTNLVGADALFYKDIDEEAIKIKIATARCARISYNNFDGSDDYEADIKLYDILLKSGHFSPFEHCGIAMSDSEYQSNIRGEFNPMESDTDQKKSIQGWCNNFKGFIQLRKTLE